jgi:tRNA threonylcarbamoyladenosine biosynthesis protein TsaB
VKFLALDTSSDACSVALQLGDEIVERHVVEAREHTTLLMPMIRSLLHDAGIALQDLDAIVLGNGPGSFIGMRIAASVAQGLAFGAGLEIVAVSSMAAIAAEVMHEHAAIDVVVAQDARMNEVYLGIYRNIGDGLPVAVGDEALHAVAKIDGLPESAAPGLLAAGKAWQKYPGFLDLNRHAIADAVDVQYPRAGYLLRLGARAWQRGKAIPPENLAPAYLRMKVADKPARA